MKVDDTEAHDLPNIRRNSSSNQREVAEYPRRKLESSTNLTISIDKFRYLSILVFSYISASYAISS